MARFPDEIDTFCVIPPLSLACRCIGFSRTHGYGCDPWQTPLTSAVETVEPCSRPLFFHQSRCVHLWVTTTS